MEGFVVPTPPKGLLRASWSLAGHELFSMNAPSFEARCHVDGFETHMKLVMPAACSVELEQEGTTVRLEGGSIGLLPLTAPFRIAASPEARSGRLFQWRLPRAVLTRRHSHLRLNGLRAIHGASPSERLLGKLLGSLADDFTELSREQTTVALSALVEALGLLESEKPSDPDAKRIERALRYIRLHRHAPELDAERVATDQGVSRRYLDDIFRRKGRASVAAAIRTERLDHALDVLRSAPDTSILPLALSLGFESASHFARRFREHTGLSPSAVRAESRQPQKTSRGS